LLGFFQPLPEPVIEKQRIGQYDYSIMNIGTEQNYWKEKNTSYKGKNDTEVDQFGNFSGQPCLEYLRKACSFLFQILSGSCSGFYNPVF
jgi:hypothetical protein